MRRYFAYGSNMSGRQMAEPDCAPDAQKIGIVELSDYEFFINERGVASVRERQGKKVIGIIYLISKEDEDKLNQKEGIRQGYYIQKDLPILNAFSYIATDRSDNPRTSQKQREYLEKIIEAAQENNFPEDYISELESWLKK